MPVTNTFVRVVFYVFITAENAALLSDVVWDVGLRTRSVWVQKIGLGLATVILVLVLQVWCCVVKRGLFTLVVVMILKDTATFQVLFKVSLFSAWNITSVEINSGVHLLKKLNLSSAFVYFRWSWSCYFGLGLYNLVLFTSLALFAWQWKGIYSH